MSFPASTDPVEIIYTPEIFSLQRVGGVSRYFVELARHLGAAGQRPILVAGLHRNEHVRALGRWTAGAYLPFGIGPLHGARLRFNRAWCRWTMARHPRALLHQSYFGDAVWPRRRPLVITVYDLIQEIYGGQFPRLRPAGDPGVANQRANCERADHLIAISATTKNDLVRLFGIAPGKITVVHLGNSMPPGASTAPPPGGEGESLLFVGTRSDYKNFGALLEAFGRSGELRRRFRLVCFGGGPFDEAERGRIAALGLAERVVQRAGGDGALAECYRQATAFVYPSLYEGFGLPLLEAMSQGCPVLCARAGSLPEIAGEAAVYFDPENAGSIQSVLETTLADPARLDALRALGRERAGLFSWERCARETLEVYRRLAA